MSSSSSEDEGDVHNTEEAVVVYADAADVAEPSVMVVADEGVDLEDDQSIDDKKKKQKDSKKRKKSKSSSASSRVSKKKKKKGPSSESTDSPKSAVKGLTLPFRAVKRIMKIDEDVATVQNEAAILVTHAAELFLKNVAKDSHHNAKQRGRNTIRYEDVAEARANNEALRFLDTLIP